MTYFNYFGQVTTQVNTHWPLGDMTATLLNLWFLDYDMNTFHISIFTIYLFNVYVKNVLTHWGRVTHICVGDKTIIIMDYYWLWLVAWLMPSHHLNQWWDIVNWTLRNKLQWNFNRNSYIFIKNAFESVVCKISAILSRPQCVNLLAQNHLLILICNIFTPFGCVLVHCLVCITDSHANLDRVVPIYLLCGLNRSLVFLELYMEDTKE